VRNIPGLAFPYVGALFSIPAIPPGVAGAYTVIAGLVPAGVPPTGIESAIAGYADRKQVVVQQGR
jgi:hypothetical protein